MNTELFSAYETHESLYVLVTLDRKFERTTIFGSEYSHLLLSIAIRK